MADLELCYHIFVLVGLALVLGNVIANLLVIDTVKPADMPPDDAPFVSVLVPARNEARCIRNCLASLAAQDYPNFEVVLLDDQSDDGTADIARSLGFSETNPKLKLLHGRALPPGWVGKNWACHELSEAARGEYLLFTDADTVHEPGMLAATIAHARKHRADLLSAWPLQITKTWSEKFVIPLIYLLALGMQPAWLLAILERRPERARALPTRLLAPLGAANGQFLLFKRSAYERIGGHASRPDHLVEDVAMGQQIAARTAEGMRLCNCDGSRVVRCRMYECFAEVWEGFTKNIRPAFGPSAAGFCVFGALQVCFFVLPFFLWMRGGPWLGLVVAQVALVYLIRLLITLRLHTSWLGLMLHPFAQLTAGAIAINSWWRASRRGVTWKGRLYRTGEAGGTGAAG